MKFEIVPAHDVPLPDQARISTDAFTGYIGGSFEMDAGKLAGFMSAQGIDLCYSRFCRIAGGPIASFGYINRTGNIVRLAGMATVAAARRSGAAAFLVKQLLKEARERRDAGMVLEVIEQNAAAVALYQSSGFDTLGRLFGWRTTRPQMPGDREAIQAISMQTALGFASPLDYPELPWQISRFAAAKNPAAQAFALDNVAVIVGNPTTSPARIHGFLGCAPSNWDTTRRLTAGLLARYPNCEFMTIPIFPDSFGTEIFDPLDFRKEPMTQFLMRKDL
jgi:ribosomal protein S18 acetylase RimI-like enzyme